MAQTRRQLMRRALALAGTSIAAAWVAPATVAAPSRRRGGFDPFALGVASGDPVSDGFVIWTRATLHGPVIDALGEAVDVIWEVAEDPAMRRIVRAGVARALPQLGHAVHVELRGLPAGRPFWYRFRLPRGDASPTGKTWTAPLVGAPMDRFSFAFASCQHFEQG
ncbi:MAG: alkaline phosphatase D family protein, partial [Alphaproteobacteria bacterium]